MAVPRRKTYDRQRLFFRKAYRSGEHGWPTHEPTPDVVRFIGRIRRCAGRGDALDLGCGEGRHTIALARQGFHVEAIDTEPLALAKARAAVRRARLLHRVRFSGANALDLPFDPARFNVVLDYGCFHHVVTRDWPLYFRNIDRVLRPGGYLILSVFSSNFRHFPGDPRKRSWTFHRNHYDHFFTPADLRRILAPRFRILSIRREKAGLWEFLHALAQSRPERVVGL